MRVKFIFSYIFFQFKLINGFFIEKYNGTYVKLPRPNKKQVILNSMHIIELADHDQAIRFVEKYNNGEYTNALNILKANRDIKNDEREWLLSIDVVCRIRKPACVGKDH